MQAGPAPTRQKNNLTLVIVLGRLGLLSVPCLGCFIAQAALREPAALGERGG